ncbi:corrinoid/iron-sulfur protein large subunit [Ruminiclostridium hungatei]|uniref:Corrinoid/iron-sulfur protein large subunit n=2 Tax=Ruminiclostridium hungatei TaxID=48256 RepID=A0A1V4SK86_RUMHU|nr:mercury methylation corrinoid protein HgcA [Ruminiclostridium hungatei]OPX43906.1 corrinoid/iron-sulfur protein large subunit [Ruminiclostridium hungatei]
MSEEKSITPCNKKDKWVTGEIYTPQGSVPVVSTDLHFKDMLGAWKVRWGIGRMNYKINPEIYAIGKPDHTSPVLVSANYKLTFDTLRKELSELNCWVLILDTKGINVWCAAGKGTFGTDELVNRISKTGLADIVSHRTLILPQLGAPGVSAHEVTRRTGFSVVYGPVRACDIKDFLVSGFKATEEMRTVKFTMWDRLVLTPVELVAAVKISLMVFGVLFLINLFAARTFGLADFIIYVGAVVTGTVLTPMLLCFIPGRAFSWKGWLLGLCWTAGFIGFNGWFVPEFLLLAIGYLLILPSLSGFLAMNFTGSSTYTSFSGVIKEMKIAVPLMVLSSAAGIVLVLIKSLWT